MSDICMKIGVILCIFINISCANAPAFETYVPSLPCGLMINASGLRIKQPNLPVKFVIDQSVPEVYHAMIREAALRWEALVGFKVVEILGVADGSMERMNPDVQLISYLGSDWPWKASYAMVTFVWSQGNTITKSSISINAGFAVRVPAEEFTTVMMHEYGHALGLAHNQTNENLMFPSWYGGEIKFENAKSNILCAYK